MVDWLETAFAPMMIPMAVPLALGAIAVASVVVWIIALRVEKGARRLVLATGGIVLSMAAPAVGMLVASTLSELIRAMGADPTRRLETLLGPFMMFLIPAWPWYPFLNTYALLLFWLPVTLMLRYVATCEKPLWRKTIGLGLLGLLVGTAVFVAIALFSGAPTD